MSIYPDASAFVAGLVREAFTDKVLSLFAESADDMVGSEWLLTEVVSALAIKERTRQIDRDERLRAHAMAIARIGELETLPIEPAHFRDAARLIERSLHPLRGGDALHLAVAAMHGAQLVTLDRRMAEAGQALGLDVRLLA